VTQIISPIVREQQIIGSMILESTSKMFGSQDDERILTRLCDHAAIAISNAQLYDEIQKANMAKTDFVSIVSHELKTPMTSIKGFTELLAQGMVGPLNDVQKNFLGTIHSNIQRMSTLVSDLTDISRIEAGRMHLEFSALSITEVLDETITAFQNHVNDKRQNIDVQRQPNLAPVWGDRNRISQIFYNLISNAIKYSPEDSTIKISIEQCPNTWEADGAPEVIHTIIEDSGWGISPDEQKKIFQKFFRSENPHIREEIGTGLGLSITKSLIELQGGKIWFTSQPGIGTTFHFTFPTTTHIK
jgi:signal transduction histidine kinase